MNILPNKHVEVKDTLLYAGAVILNELKTSLTVSELWNRTENHRSIQSFERFIATLDMLYIMGLIDFRNDKLVIR